MWLIGSLLLIGVLDDQLVCWLNSCLIEYFRDWHISSCLIGFGLRINCITGLVVSLITSNLHMTKQETV